MAGSNETPTTIEQMTINNLVNVEAMLDVLISSGVITEQAFVEAKGRIEQKIIAAQREAQRASE